MQMQRLTATWQQVADQRQGPAGSYCAQHVCWSQWSSRRSQWHGVGGPPVTGLAAVTICPTPSCLPRLATVSAAKASLGPNLVLPLAEAASPCSLPLAAGRPAP